MRYRNSVFLFSIFFVLIGLTVFLLSSKDIKTDMPEEPPVVSFLTVSIPIPDKVEFCGNTLSLERLDMRERFDREITSMVYLHSTTLLYFKRANRYFPLIAPILKKNGIPDDFKYLCVIESNLDTRALSPAKAAGLWQFMESTGAAYGLQINAEVDERYHIEKATEAACSYFKEAYNKYGDWAKVAISYNAGMGRISSAQSSQRVDSAFDLLLVSETSRYAFRIMALKEIFSHPKKYGFILKKENLYPPVECSYVDVNSDIDDLALFAQTYGINYMQLKEYNVWLRDTKLKVSKGKSYQIAIPKQEDLYFNKEKIKVYDENWVNGFAPPDHSNHKSL